MENSRPLKTDRHGRPLPALPQGSVRLRRGEIWLLSTKSGQSFDSRYFGALPADSIEGIAMPVWVFE